MRCRSGDVISTPTVVSASFALLENLTVGGGLFTTSRDTRSATSQGTARSADGDVLKQRLSLLSDDKKLHVGGSFGFDAGRGLRVGGGMFAVLTTSDATFDYAIAASSAASPEQVVAFSRRIGRKTWGLQPSAGIQWDASPRAHLGITFRMPELLLSSSVESTTADIAGTSGGNALTLTDEKGSTRRTGWIDPAHLVFGLAIEPSRSWRISGDFDLGIGIENRALGAPKRTVFDARVGALWHVVDRLDLGLGAFYDLPLEKLAEELAATRVTYFGGTFGGTFRTPLRVGEDERPDALVLTTTVAVRYAAGVGRGRQLTLTEDGTRARDVSILIHDLMPYTGSAILF